MALIRTLTVSTTVFERTKEKFYGFRQTVLSEKQHKLAAIHFIFFKEIITQRGRVSYVLRNAKAIRRFMKMGEDRELTMFCKYFTVYSFTKMFLSEDHVRDLLRTVLITVLTEPECNSYLELYSSFIKKILR